VSTQVFHAINILYTCPKFSQPSLKCKFPIRVQLSNLSAWQILAQNYCPVLTLSSCGKLITLSIQILNQLTMTNGDIPISFDVESMFTKVPLSDSWHYPEASNIIWPPNPHCISRTPHKHCILCEPGEILLSQKASPCPPNTSMIVFKAEVVGTSLMKPKCCKWHNHHSPTWAFCLKRLPLHLSSIHFFVDLFFQMATA
jgi:hypothetical protein